MSETPQPATERARAEQALQQLFRIYPDASRGVVLVAKRDTDEGELELAWSGYERELRSLRSEMIEMILSVLVPLPDSERARAEKMRAALEGISNLKLADLEGDDRFARLTEFKAWAQNVARDALSAPVAPLPDSELATAIAAKTREIEAAGLCEWKYAPAPTDDAADWPCTFSHHTHTTRDEAVALRALVEKWRDAAVWEHESGDARQSGVWDQCADELTALLARTS